MAITRKKGEFWVAFILFFLIIAMIGSIILSIVSFVYYTKQKDNMEKISANLEKKLSELGERVARVENLVGPNSVIDKYITSANFLMNTSVDLEKVVEEIFDDPTTGYLRLFVVGNESVWITIKKGDSTYFSKELKPGLAPYKLYYFKEPNIQTQYSMRIPSDSTIVIGKPGYVYFLVYGVGTSKHPTKVVQWKESRIDNLAKDFSLYIPK